MAGKISTALCSLNINCSVHQVAQHGLRHKHLPEPGTADQASSLGRSIKVLAGLKSCLYSMLGSPHLQAAHLPFVCTAVPTPGSHSGWALALAWPDPETGPALSDEQPDPATCWSPTVLLAELRPSLATGQGGPSLGSHWLTPPCCWRGCSHQASSPVLSLQSSKGALSAQQSPASPSMLLPNFACPAVARPEGLAG